MIGEIVGAEGFSASSLFCKWGAVAGSQWVLLEGDEQGQTHVDVAEDGAPAVWAHPLDVHYLTKGLTGWPKLFFQVWSQDVHGRSDLAGYGFVHVPTAAGVHEVEVATWQPEGTVGERLSAALVGGAPRLLQEELVYAAGDRYRLQTRSAGTVRLNLSVIFKDFDQHNISWS